MSALIQADRPTAGGHVPPEPELFEQTVRRSVVHRAAVSEVLLTGFRPNVGETYRFGVQWPRGHSYYGAVAGRWHDPMIFAESIRQVGFYLAHEVLDVPYGTHFISDTTSFRMAEEGCRLAVGPAHVLLEATLTKVARRREAVTAYAYEVTARRDGRIVGTGRMSAQLLPKRIYQRLRGAHLTARPALTVPAPVNPRLVGRSAAFDVVLAEGPEDRTHVLRIDGSHPVLFDHPVDHVPGMVLLEAARQSALAGLERPDGLLVSADASFTKYVEFDEPCLITHAPPVPEGDGCHRLDVRFQQAGAPVGRCDVVIRDGAARCGR
ncbi:ScbA/BarX family gamma-butyrolactone biosynthesis protein [Streptomyces beihaiensis]|uniref:ScbA/BarX family gamma-butyrolactone biosynthesis protein n=1 Tax=Streptomyces beihaiensis TaxID=2984495 RepID=A0ABT3U647_9ACTN|nr:ScbA/BarX family gamma-butyrolactone biosynthesis protein [Streptomyces beihaiensis]MCX3063658.1 ScbA/BarX family gamma-butyrolactone biosynthesis protein [Streptomyces beihaiensis]